MTEPQTQIGHPFATNPAFQQWSEGQGQDFHFVYASQGDGVWKFTPEEWWRFVTRTIHNNGAVILWTLEDWKNELRVPS
jgi:hypothetical protein